MSDPSESVGKPLNPLSPASEQAQIYIEHESPVYLSHGTSPPTSPLRLPDSTISPPPPPPPGPPIMRPFLSGPPPIQTQEDRVKFLESLLERDDWGFPRQYTSNHRIV
ncbi:hypothetical protein F4861DRAFT_535579 [Xylaria intraflava]|nr:hypothetical protein F4861DRAFT_535579 [Xylaria intraflava]